MSFGSRELDAAYDRWVTRTPEDDTPICEDCGEHHYEDQGCEE